ncbi:MAG TPA: class I SAM-dependent methyltransferase [Anaeromyxobacteraceae bacterium]|nr:class I SAM-dependent methyltransferase [Anaeromyxobacteraceae bacterium]
MDARQAALVDLGRALADAGYAFVTPTPETHRRVVSRSGGAPARDLRDVFGWSLPFEAALLPAALHALVERAGALRPASEGRWRSAIRFSSAEGALLAHSAYPTLDADAVFLGPDTYRFLGLLRREASWAERAVDVGCGTGAGGIALARAGVAGHVVLADVSPAALRLAEVNAALAGVAAEVMESDVLAAVPGPIDLVVANPPYLVDARRRTYRDGGGPLGIDLSVRIAREALDRLDRGGRLVLYTATPIQAGGRDPLREALEPLLAGADEVTYEELDPDVFGEELEGAAYERTERIAVVGVIARRRARAAG